MNMKIAYLYRDADNYKVWNECVVSGVLTDEQKQRILACRYEGEWFLPSAVGLPEERFSEWDPQSDHPWFELGEHSFEETDRKATVDVTAAQLVELFKGCKDKWEALAAVSMEEYNPMDTVYSINELLGMANRPAAMTEPAVTMEQPGTRRMDAIGFDLK